MNPHFLNIVLYCFVLISVSNKKRLFHIADGLRCFETVLFLHAVDGLVKWKVFVKIKSFNGSSV